VRLCPVLRRLSADHARMLSELASRARADRADGGARLLDLWDGVILPHFRAEEEVLLPELARRLSETDALVVFTMGDHVVLRNLARDLKLAAGPARAAAADAFLGTLSEHVDFEERTLLPALQETLGCERLASLEGELGAAAATRPGRKS
jgi:hypothetical protein